MTSLDDPGSPFGIGFKRPPGVFSRFVMSPPVRMSLADVSTITGEKVGAMLARAEADERGQFVDSLHADVLYRVYLTQLG
jgi:hypothetical protein